MAPSTIGNASLKEVLRVLILMAKLIISFSVFIGKTSFLFKKKYGRHGINGDDIKPTGEVNSRLKEIPRGHVVPGRIF